MLAMVTLAMVVVLPVVLKGTLGSLQVFEPLTILSIGFLLYFVIGPAISLITHQTAYLGRDLRSVYLLGFLGVIASTLFMWTGYILPLGRRVGRWMAVRLCVPTSRRPPKHQQQALMRKAGAALVFGGAIGLAASFALGRGGSVESVVLPGVLTPDRPYTGPTPAPTLNYLFLMLEWSIPGYLLLLGGGAFRGRRWLGLALAILILIVFVSIGFRFRIVIFFLAIATLRYAGTSARRALFALSIGGLAALLFVGYVGAARGYFRSGGAYGSAALDSSGLFYASRSDTRIFDTYAAVLDAVPGKISYAGLAPAESVFVLPIPRGIWPAKPEPEWLQKIAKAIGTPSASAAGLAVPNFGEYYLALGWFGVAMGMVVFGAAARALHAFWLTSEDDGFARVIYACSLPFLMQTVTRGYTAQIVQEWCFIVLPAVVVALLAKRRILRISVLLPAQTSNPREFALE